MRLTRIRALLIVLVLAGSAAQPAARQLASRPADEWIKLLESPGRVASLRIDEIIAKLQLKPGNVVADLGAGSGVFSLPLARAVGPTGRVYAVEIEQGLLDYIGTKVKDQNVGNVRTVLGKFGDPALPAADVDVAFLHDVLHHVADRPGYLKQVVRYLTPAGRVAIVEPDAVKGPHANDPTLQVTREELDTWMTAIGFVRTEAIPLSEDKWYVIYGRK